MGTEIDGVNGIIKNTTSDGDITIKGNDGGSEITALTLDMSVGGQLLASPLGVSIPSYSFSGDANTGMTRPTSDALQFVTAGSEAVRIDSSQRVGIGTSSPSSNLHIGGTTPTLTIGDAGAEDTKIVFDGNAQDFYVALDDSEDDLVIGLGSTVGTTPIMSFDENKDVVIHDGGLSITTADNTDTLTLTSTDADANNGPKFVLNRDSGSPADNDNCGIIKFKADDDGGNSTELVNISATFTDVSNGAEDATFNISSVIGGSQMGRFTATASETVLNDDSGDIDFRVESNGNTAMLHVNAGNDSVGIGTDSSVAPLHLMTNAPNFRISDANSTSEDSATGSIQFYDRNSDINSEILSGTGSTANLYITNYNSREIILQTNGQNDRLTVKSTGRVGIGQSSPAAKLDVEISDTNVPALEAHATSGSYSTEVVKIACSRNSTDSSYKFIACNVPGVNDRFQVVDDGDVLSATNSYGSLSDSRLKSDIVDANSQWDDIKALKIRNYKKFDMPNLTQIGVVAQELEAAGMTGLVDPQNPNEYEIAHNSAFGTLYTADDAETKDGNDDVLFVAEDAAVQNGRAKVGDIKEYATHSKKVGDVKEVKEQVKTVKYSVLYMKAIKALQEAMTRIETLEAEVTALKG